MNTKKNKETSTSIHPFIVGSLLVTGVWFGSILLLNFLFGNSHNEKVAWFGDSFGGVNSLFSGLAFAGIIYTILLQRKELQLQRQELRETREELKRSADAQEKSEAAFTKQIEIMNKTAQLNGWSHIIKYYEIAYTSTTIRTSQNIYQEEMRKAREKIEEVMEELEPKTYTETYTE